MSAGQALVAAAAVPAVADWVAVARGSRPAEYVSKPATLAVLIAAAVLLREEAPSHQWAWIVPALALSLAGDVLLMLPGDRLVAGLGAFLLAHLCYVVAFTPSAPPGEAWLALAAVATTSAGLFVRIRRGLVAGGARSLVGPVAAYVVAISLMVASAWSTLWRPAFPDAAAAAAAVGAVLFYASDALIGWSRFVRPLPGAPVAIMVLYHVGQAALVLSLAR